ncbi:MAG: hypothetical protein KKD01_17790 [Proteobacteria bacterium]|nr:hypothetical protein [Pseudomonadota bacterium]MBU1419560.1 hypothetical protein [Pseudomonadota bacterium]MBU1456576.1 hypothetical protein [Pseudomonadota bacterium]
MKTIDVWFSESIEQYNDFTVKTEELRENIELLSIEKIMQRLDAIRKLQEDIAERDGKLHALMDFTGSDVLENPLIGDYQRALDTAIRETDRVSSKMQLRKILLMQKTSNVQAFRKDSFEYVTAIKKYNSLLQ